MRSIVFSCTHVFVFELIERGGSLGDPPAFETQTTGESSSPRRVLPAVQTTGESSSPRRVLAVQTTGESSSPRRVLPSLCGWMYADCPSNLMGNRRTSNHTMMGNRPSVLSQLALRHVHRALASHHRCRRSRILRNPNKSFPGTGGNSRDRWEFLRITSRNTRNR